MRRSLTLSAFALLNRSIAPHCDRLVTASNKQKQYRNILHRRKTAKIKDHGRIETRRYILISAHDPLFFTLRWPEPKGLGKINRVRTTNNEVTRSTRYFLTSLAYEETFLEAVRKHWQIEVDLHWSLDVSCKEEHSQIHIGYAAENLALIRRIVLNLLKQETSHKNGITCKRKTAGWEHSFLLKVLHADRHFVQT